MIDGVKIVALKRIPDERGTVLHMLKASDSHFLGFGEIYFSSIYPQVVKGWHWHEEMVLNYACIVGGIKLVLYDERDASSTKGEVQEIFLSRDNYSLVQIPAQVWNGITALGAETAMVANCATKPHDPAKIRRLDPHSSQIPYDWTRRDA